MSRYHLPGLHQDLLLKNIVASGYKLLWLPPTSNMLSVISRLLRHPSAGNNMCDVCSFCPQKSFLVWPPGHNNEQYWIPLYHRDANYSFCKKKTAKKSIDAFRLNLINGKIDTFSNEKNNWKQWKSVIFYVKNNWNSVNNG